VEHVTPVTGPELALLRDLHKVTRDPSAPFEVHDMEKVTLPCSNFIRGVPEPLLWHPDGHEGVRCRDCGVVLDFTLSGEYDARFLKEE
jgi:hypothetical protein